MAKNARQPKVALKSRVDKSSARKRPFFSSFLFVSFVTLQKKLQNKSWRMWAGSADLFTSRGTLINPSGSSGPDEDERVLLPLFIYLLLKKL
jgi:hypothetical protein